MVTDHEIIKGNEKFGVCGRCGLQGDLTQMSCEEHQSLRKQIEKKLRETQIPTAKCWMCGETVYIADFALAVAMTEAGEIDDVPKKPTCRKCLIKVSQHPTFSVKVSYQQRVI